MDVDVDGLLHPDRLVDEDSSGLKVLAIVTWLVGIGSQYGRQAAAQTH